MIMKLRANDFRTVLFGEKLPVLLACLHHSEQYDEQLTALNAVAKAFVGILQVCLVNHDQDNVAAVCRAYGIQGTPTFLLLSQGAERNRLLGHVDGAQLASFVRQALRRDDDVAAGAS